MEPEWNFSLSSRVVYSPIFGRSAADAVASGSCGLSTDEEASMVALSSYSSSPGGGFPTGHYSSWKREGKENEVEGKKDDECCEVDTTCTRDKEQR